MLFLTTVFFLNDIKPILMLNGNKDDSVHGTEAGVDEIKEYYNCRYISACEATWRIFSFNIHYRYPSVERLSFHLPGEQNIVYEDDADLCDVLNKPTVGLSMFMAWMERNKVDAHAHTLTYVEFPTSYVWNISSRKWTPRKQRKCIGRIHYVPISTGYSYYLRVLLNKVRGRTSHEDIRTVNGILYPSYKEACYALGLLDDDKEYVEAIEEASKWATAASLRSLFVRMFLSNTLSKPDFVWTMTWKYLSDDVLYKQRIVLKKPDLQLEPEVVKNLALFEIEQLLRRNGSTLKKMDGMPYPDNEYILSSTNRLIHDELAYDKDLLKVEHDKLLKCLTDEQKTVYESVMSAVEMGDGGMFFLYGYGGTGKTFIWKTLSAALRSKGEIVLNVASSGIAALLLSGGRTAHSRFAIPINIHEESFCSVNPNSDLAALIKKAKLIIWDEAPMIHKHCFEALDRTLRDILRLSDPSNEEKLFGGKVVVFGGDFRQILPVIPKGSRHDIVNASLNSSYLWDHCRVLKLTVNMRLQVGSLNSDLDEIKEFGEWILKIGNGTVGEPNDGESIVEVPDDILIKESTDPVGSIISFVYPNVVQKLSDHTYFQDKAILAPTHEVVDVINDRVLSMIPGDETVYLSSDSICESDQATDTNAAVFSPDFLNSLKFSGLPNHKLILKVGVIIMLLRNIDQPNGLCNGTRLQVVRLDKHVIEAKIITGSNIGDTTLITRQKMNPSDKRIPFKVVRRQFPIAVCFAMTINKSQGQSLARVGLFLPRPVFTHGQLYVAVSRVKSKKGLKVLVCDNDAGDHTIAEMSTRSGNSLEQAVQNTKRKRDTASGNRASGTNITFANNCEFTVWPGIWSIPNFSTTGFEFPKGTSVSFEAPSGWGGRIWGRTGCNFDVSGNGSCTTGECDSGEVECNGNIFNNEVATTQAVISLNVSQGIDWYEVSLDYGYNLPMLIEPTGGSSSGLERCAKTGCIDDFIQRCPSELRSGGGCLTACQAFGTPEYCCSSSFGSPKTCKPTAYAQLFLSACPRSINSSPLIVSILGTFTLGFFDEDYKYLGVWYTSDVEARKVWVANLDYPIASGSMDHALTIDAKTGNLIITSASSTLMRITDVDLGPNPNVTATLENNGNFLLINEVDKKVLWQSFDYPTNILLPGMKLGYDMTIGKNWTLTSWLSKEIPNSGTFTLSWEPIEEASQRLMIRRRGQPYWTRGNLNSQMFQFMFALNQSRYNLTSVYTNEAQYFSYKSINADLPMWILTPKGQIRDSDNSAVSTPEFCYGYDSSNGCVKESSLPQCRRESDSFSEKNGEFEPDNCVGFNSSNTNETGCVIWTGSKNFLVNPRANSTLKYVINENPISPSTAEYVRRKRHATFLELTASESFKDIHELETDGGKGNNLVQFSFASIMAATDDFSLENKLGQGGFGPVYKGKLRDGREIAIKRLSRTSGQGLVEFKNELTLVAKLQHTNLVRVLGCCIHGEEKMIIYEYMPNKSLDFFLFDENRKAELNCPKRFSIIEGIAQGLLYLHKYSRMRVIHRDLKANNILLDENLNPKISDFGMARIFKDNETEAMTNRIVGTYGYMSPEYALDGTFSIKSDIFSFGVSSLEILSGRRNSRNFNLIEHAWELWRQGDIVDLQDPKLGDTCVVEQFLRTVHVALLCVQQNAQDRPTTSEMIAMLLNDTMSLPNPNTPAFVMAKPSSDECKEKHCSVNTMTISVEEGR
ncbi:G-type lectin S-receptor-like serine/threonine-protein kinase [Tanacetum coccineum]|uniref:ATP-dependent DNA helicase n=1 Tax=Tanacetum coccineum TaxID=301880 RepID=A0ABQ4YCF0_9ASTR